MDNRVFRICYNEKVSDIYRLEHIEFNEIINITPRMNNGNTFLANIKDINYLLCENTGPIGFDLENISNKTLVVYLTINDKIVANIILRPNSKYFMNNRNLSDQLKFNIEKTKEKVSFEEKKENSKSSNNIYKFDIFSEINVELPKTLYEINHFNIKTHYPRVFVANHYIIDNISTSFTYIEEVCASPETLKWIKKYIELEKTCSDNINKLKKIQNIMNNAETKEYNEELHYGEEEEEEEEEESEGGGMFGGSSSDEVSYVIKNKSIKTKTVFKGKSNENLKSRDMMLNKNNKLSVEFQVVSNNNKIIYNKLENASRKDRLILFMELSEYSNPKILFPTENCCICLEAKPTITFGCGHRCTCNNCYNNITSCISTPLISQRVTSCPLCRKFISVAFI